MLLSVPQSVVSNEVKTLRDHKRTVKQCKFSTKKSPMSQCSHSFRKYLTTVNLASPKPKICILDMVETCAKNFASPDFARNLNSEKHLLPNIYFREQQQVKCFPIAVVAMQYPSAVHPGTYVCILYCAAGAVPVHLFILCGLSSINLSYTSWFSRCCRITFLTLWF